MMKGLEAAARQHYVPDSNDVLFYSSMLDHWATDTLYTYAPEEPGDYPFMCTVPGHWRIMNGILRVE